MVWLQIHNTLKKKTCLSFFFNPKSIQTQINIQPQHQMPLIITSGDVSDVDGFLALAEYAKTGADVLYTMNYPAYLAGDAAEEDFEAKHPGLGFR